MSDHAFITACTTHARPSRNSLISRLTTVLALWRSRRQLASLAPHQLADIGISEKAAKTEANRPIWDVPAHWVK